MFQVSGNEAQSSACCDGVSVERHLGKYGQT
jgi:hypothetical protein